MGSHYIKSTAAIETRSAIKRWRQNLQEVEELELADSLSFEAQHNEDIGDCEYVLSKDFLWSSARQRVQGWLTWLKANPGSTLTRHLRSQLSKTVRTARRIDGGHLMPRPEPPPDERAAWERANPVGRGRRVREQLPAWLRGEKPELPTPPNRR